MQSRSAGSDLLTDRGAGPAVTATSLSWKVEPPRSAEAPAALCAETGSLCMRQDAPILPFFWNWCSFQLCMQPDGGHALTNCLSLRRPAGLPKGFLGLHSVK